MDPTFFIDDYQSVLSNRQGSTVPNSDLKMTDAIVDDFLDPNGSNPVSSLARVGGGGLASSSRPDLYSTGTFLTSVDEPGTYFSNLKTPGMRLERPIQISARQLDRVTDLMVAMSGGTDGSKDDSAAGGDAGVMRLEPGGGVFTPTLGGRLSDMPTAIASVASADGGGARYEGITNTSLDDSWISSSPPASEPLRSGSQVRRLQEIARRPNQSPNARRSLNLPSEPQPPPGRSRRPNQGVLTTDKYLEGDAK